MQRNISRLFLTSLLFCTLPSHQSIAQTGTTPAAAPDSSRIYSVEDFATLPFMEGPELSPDGTKVAARIAMHGEQKLAVIAIGKADTPPVAVAMGENDLNFWSWVNDDWLVAGIGTTEVVDGSDWYIRRTVGISADGKKINPIAFKEAAQNADDVIWTARDGTPRILLGMQTSIFYSYPGFWPEVAEVDISTGRRKTVVSSRQYVRGWYADASGAVRIGVGYNDFQRSSRLLYRPDNRSTFRTIDRADKRKDEELTVPALFLSDPIKAVAFDENNGFNALYDLDLSTLTLGKRIFGVDGYDIDCIIADQAGNGLAGVRYTDDRPRTHWFDPRMAQIQSEIDKAVGDRQAHIISWSRDWSKLLVHVGGADRPGAYYFYAPETGVMQLFARKNEKLGTKPLNPVKTIRYKARDGLEIAAVLTLPRSREAKNLPLILLPHGGPFTRDEESWSWWVQFLAERGYAVLQPNYRGSSGYGSAFAAKGEGQWGLAMQDDLNDALDWAVKQGITDPKRVCIAGASYGGYAAMRAAQRDGGKFRCAISYAGVSDLSSMMRYDSRFLDHGGRKDWMKEQAPEFRAVSPVHFPEQFSTPILLMHGKKDLRVQVKQSREMVEKLKAAGKEYRYVEQPLGDHHFSRQEDRLQFLKEMEAFLAKHNPA